MAHIVVIGAGIGGLPTAYELRHLLPREHRITLISNQPRFTFIPSLPWVGLGLMSLDRIQLEVSKLLKNRGIAWSEGKVTRLDPEGQKLWLGEEQIEYDYLAIATGAELALDETPGLGPENGWTHSVCNANHAILAREAWEKFLKNPGPLVVGAMPKVSCMGPAYEFALLADYVLRKLKLRDRVPITFLTPEPYPGHLGIGGMADSYELVTRLLAKRKIEVIANAEITEIAPEKIALADGSCLPHSYAMLLPPFRGPRFVRELPGFADKDGFIPVLPTCQHPRFSSIYAAGVVVQLAPPEATAVPVGVPKTGQMTEAMGMAVAHNIALKLGAISGATITPTLDAICMADFGDTGLVFIADPVLPDPVTKQRTRAFVKQGRWVCWSKVAFEQYFLAKMRFGLAIPWFERFGLKLLGLSLVEATGDSTPIAGVTQWK